MCKGSKKKGSSSSSASSSSSSSSSSDWTRSDAYGELRTLGASVGGQTSFTVPLLAAAERLRLGFLDRALDDDTQKLIEKAKLFGSRFRSTHDAQDELWSTASTRHFLNGLLAGRSKADIPAAQWNDWIEAVDLISRLRIPTRFSGYATANGVMQHPTEPGQGLFSTAAVFGPHGALDSARVKYIGAAVRRARLAGETVLEQFLTAARASIQFSLNYFTAPITASNVQPYSAMAGVDPRNTVLLEQLAAREYIKGLYVALGGTLRELVNAETPAQSLVRPWQEGIPITPLDPYPVAPPSPNRDLSETVDPLAAPPVLADNLSAFSPMPALPLLGSLPTSAFPVSRKRQRVDDEASEAMLNEAVLDRALSARATFGASGESALDADFLWDQPNYWRDSLADSSSELSDDLIDDLQPEFVGQELLGPEAYPIGDLPSAPPYEDSIFFNDAYFVSTAPSAPPLSDDDPVPESLSGSSSGSFVQDDAVADSFPMQNAFDMQSSAFQNMTQAEFDAMFPPVPTGPIGAVDDNLSDDAVEGGAEADGLLAVLV